MKKQLTIQAIKPLYSGFFNAKQLCFTHTLYNGKTSPSLERELFQRGHAVVVLLYDSRTEQVILVEQCRVGAVFNVQEKSQSPEKAWLLEPLAGMIDAGESVIEAGIREANEETGVTLTELEFICQYYPSPGACDEQHYLYAADISIDEVVDYAGQESEGEDIKIVSLSFIEAKNKLLNAEFQVAATYIALQWLFFQKLSSSSLK